MAIQDINGLVKVLRLEENSNAELNAEMDLKLKVGILSIGTVFNIYYISHIGFIRLVECRFLKSFTVEPPPNFF